MKAQIKVVVFLVLFIASKLAASPTNEPPAHWGATAEGFHLGIHMEKQTIAVGETVSVDVLLENTSTTNLIVGSGRASGPGGAFYDGYGVVVSRSTNQLPSLVKRRTDPFSPDIFSGSSGFLEVAPGEIHHHMIRMDQEFDLKSPGTYTVYVTTRVRKLQDRGTSEIQSEAVSFEIVDHITP